MAFNFVRAGSAGVLGIASGVLAPPTVAPIQISGTAGAAGSFALGVDAVAEIAGLVGGGLLQFVSPMTMPNLADGLVDGGLALLLRRTSHYAVAAFSSTPLTTFQRGWANAGMPYRANGATYGGVHAASARGVQSNTHPGGQPTLRVA